MSKRGFTLIEVLAVTALAALLVTLAAVSLVAAANRATMDDVVEHVIDYDAGARILARRFGRPVVLTFDPRGVSQQTPDGPELHERHRLQLPGGYRLEWTDPAGDRANLRISSAGRSRSYGLAIRGPHGQHAWIVVAGLTGQVTRLSSAEAAAALLAVATPTAEGQHNAPGVEEWLLDP
jgi:prepilin-type N-terminal cleavage/methylation domain-containing protein